MADNHSPYDPDPRQGRGGDRRTQALQAVSQLSSSRLHFFSPGAPRLRWAETRRLPAAAAGLERRQRAACIVGITSPASRLRSSRTRVAARESPPQVPTSSFRAIMSTPQPAVRDSRQEAKVSLQRPRPCQEKSRRRNKRTTRAPSTSSIRPPPASRIDTGRPAFEASVVRVWAPGPSVISQDLCEHVFLSVPSN